MASTSRQKHLFEDYDGFVEKFKPKKTTDDCYTPPDVYDCVSDWACERFGIDPSGIVRPFWPGGDYESFDYPEGCTVLDNPPFSILSKICEFYLDRGIGFFLFAPALTALSGAKTCMRTNHVFADCDIEYHNGAVVRTSFVTSFGDNVAETAPDLFRAVKRVQDERRSKERQRLPKYSYPSHVLTAAMLGKYAKYGVRLEVKPGDCVLVSALDARREAGKSVYGKGLLLSDEAAARHAAAERAAAEQASARIWELSDRERAIVESLGSGEMTEEAPWCP